MKEINTSLLTKKCLKLIAEIDEMILYYGKAKNNAKPEFVTVSDGDYKALQKSMKTEGQIKRFGVTIKPKGLKI